MDIKLPNTWSEYTHPYKSHDNDHGSIIGNVNITLSFGKLLLLQNAYLHVCIENYMFIKLWFNINFYTNSYFFHSS